MAKDGSSFWYRYERVLWSTPAQHRFVEGNYSKSKNRKKDKALVDIHFGADPSLFTLLRSVISQGWKQIELVVSKTCSLLAGLLDDTPERCDEFMVSRRPTDQPTDSKTRRMV